ncbi:MAG: hypothetical protein GY810_26280 [Aureispira sp.]|nr:hypothetical protein [Aureispira sp.]
MQFLKKISYLLLFIYLGFLGWYLIDAPAQLTDNLMLWLGLTLLAFWLTLIVYTILEKSYKRIKTETDKAADVLDSWNKDL